MAGRVTANKMEVVTSNSNHQCVGMAVSVCTTPAAPSPIPVPYPTMAPPRSPQRKVKDAPMRTRVAGSEVLTVGGIINGCVGNEPGTLKEVVSLNTSGPCFPLVGTPGVITELGMTCISNTPCQMNKQGVGVGAGGGGGGGGGGGAGGGGGGGPGAAPPAPSANAPSPTGGGGGGPSGGPGASGSSGGGAAGSSGSPSGTLFTQEEPMSCGMASARMVINDHTGHDPGEAALRQQSSAMPHGYDPVNGTRMDNVEAVLRANGVSSATLRHSQSVADLQTATAGGRPAIVHVANSDGSGHFMVCDGVTTNSDGTNSVHLRDPLGSQTTMSDEQFMNRGYSGWAVTT